MSKVIDKSEWSRGEWDAEPDLQNFTTANGMAGAIIRMSHSGHLCGYVGVPVDHPWHGKEYSAEVMPSAEQLARPVDIDKISIISLFCSAGSDPAEGSRIDCLIDVHGGLTYSGAGTAEYDEDPALWYFGFDCAHSGDLSPAIDGRYPQFRIGGETYRNIEYVRGEVESLAAQMGAVSAAAATPASPITQLKWFSFHQNNSGGHFVVDDKVSEFVFIQAVSAEAAIATAEQFCDNSDSCECCGDRWSFWVRESDGTAEPQIYDEPMAAYSSHWVKSFARLHHYDGRIEAYPPAALAIADAA